MGEKSINSKKTMYQSGFFTIIVLSILEIIIDVLEIYIGNPAFMLILGFTIVFLLLSGHNIGLLIHLIAAIISIIKCCFEIYTKIYQYLEYKEGLKEIIIIVFLILAQVTSVFIITNSNPVKFYFEVKNKIREKSN